MASDHQEANSDKMAEHNTGIHQSSGLYHAVFHTGHSERVLFPTFIISTEAHLVGACFIVFLIALLHEAFRLLGTWLQKQINSQHKRGEGGMWLLGTLHTGFYLLHLFLGYCLMVVFMSLNVWLCFSILLGAGVGFLLFHFRPVKTRFLHLLCKGGNPGDGTDNGSTGGTALGYEQLDDYKQDNDNKVNQ